MLAGRGHDVHVLSCLGQQEDKDYVDRGVSVHRRKLVRVPGLKRLNRVFKIPITLASVQAGISTFLEYRRLKLEFDVIEYPDDGAEGWVFALKQTIPLVCHLHLPIPIWGSQDEAQVRRRDFLWASWFQHFAIRRADMITAPSRHLVNRLEEFGWLRNVRPTLIPQYIHWPDWAETEPIQETTPTVLFLSWLGRNKAPEILVEALSLLRKRLPEAKAKFVGMSHGQREGLPYLEWIKQSGMDLTGCQFMGFVPRDEVIHCISTTRVLAMPSWFENYSIAALEAMAGGRPVVVTETNGVAELVKKTDAGRVIPPGDSKALAEALLPFLTDAAYAAEVGERAKMAVREHLAPQKIAGQRERAYQHCIKSFNRKKEAKRVGRQLWNVKKLVKKH